MEWIDTEQQVVYNEKENEWVQTISWKVDARTLHADLVYNYGTGEFLILSPYEDQGIFEAVIEEKNEEVIQDLLRDEAFVYFLGERKTIYDQLQPFLLKKGFEIQDIVIKKDGKFMKEMMFSLEENLVITAYFEKQVDWSLQDITVQTNQHTLPHLFQDTDIEKQIETQLRKHLV